jgi:hypothetical protein
MFELKWICNSIYARTTINRGSIIIFCLFIHLHIGYMICPPNYITFLKVFKLEPFYFTGYLYWNLYFLKFLRKLWIVVLVGAAYVTYRHSKCISNKLLFEFKPLVSRCCVEPCFSLFVWLLEIKLWFFLLYRYDMGKSTRRCIWSFFFTL